ncbi:hypothetical protein BKA69DRAFT_27438 [Paraphysoderma sedebokerense]|nr:hypothetical protein BKA69DRAFT_27438 [Paraphysoderma sedebokerense]
MKFAKTLTSIASQLPEEYLYYTIDYKTFKKLLNRVVKELETQGLSETLLHQIHLGPNQSSSTPIPSTKLSYVLSPVSSNEASESTSEISSEFHPFLLKTEEEKTEKNTIDFVPKPYLWLFIDDDSEVPHLHEPSDVDEPLQLSTALDFGCPPNSSIAECPAEKPDDLPSHPPTSEICYPNPSFPGQMICSTDDAGTTRRRLLYHLPSDAQFFSLLTISLAKLHDYQTLILKKRFELEIERLLEVLGSIVR